MKTFQDKLDRSPLRVLVLRAVDGAGGGADEIILRTAQTIDRHAVRMQLCFFRHVGDAAFTFEDRCRELGLNYSQILHRGPFDFTVSRQLRRIIQEFRPDVVHSHDYKASFFNRLAARRNRHKLLATSHGWTGHGFVERNIYYPSDRIVLRSFDRIVAVSNEIRDTLIESGVPAQRIDVLLNGIDPAEYVPSSQTRQLIRARLGLVPSDIVLGGIGRLEHQKRFDLTLEVVDRLRRQLPQVKLMIAGEGSLRNELEAKIRQRQLEGICRLLGHRDDIRDIYQALDVLVQASDYEGTPTVVVEAMALKIPIVATDAGGTTQLAVPNQHALIEPCGDVVGLANAIRRTIDEPEATRQRVNAARARVETELTFAARTARLARIYSELANNAPQLSKDVGN